MLTSQLGEEMLKEAIASLTKTKVTAIDIQRIILECGSEKNDNFSCSLQSVSVTASITSNENSDYHFMIKCLPQMCINEDKDLSILTLECIFYQEVLPQLRSIGCQLSTPKCYFVSLEKNVIIMENLKIQGYTVHPTKMTGDLDQNHVNVILDEFANLHASSYVLFSQNKLSKLERLLEAKESSKNITIFKNYFVNVLQSFCVGNSMVLKEVSSRHRLKEFCSLIPRIYETYRRASSELNVLTHGDGWPNNFMFKYNKEGTLASVKFLDWQILRKTDPTIDLIFFFFASTTVEFRDKHLEDSLKYYYASLEARLNQFELTLQKIRPFSQFMKEFNRHLSYGFVIANFLLTLSCYNSNHPDGPPIFHLKDVGESLRNPSQVYDPMKKAASQLIHNEHFIKTLESLVREAFQKQIL